MNLLLRNLILCILIWGAILNNGFSQSKNNCIDIYNNKDYGNAIECFENILDRARADREIYFYLGSAYFHKNPPDLDAAKSWLKHAVDSQNAKPLWKLELAKVYDLISQNKKRTDRADAENEALKLYDEMGPQSEEANYNRGQMYHRNHDYENAIKNYEIVIRLNGQLMTTATSSWIAAYSGWAELLSHQGFSELAEQKYLIIIAKQPDHLETRIKLRDFYKSLRQNLKADEQDNYIRSITENQKPKGSNEQQKKMKSSNSDSKTLNRINRKESSSPPQNPLLTVPDSTEKRNPKSIKESSMLSYNLFLRFGFLFFLLIWILIIIIIIKKKNKSVILKNFVYILTVITIFCLIISIKFDEKINLETDYPAIISIFFVLIFFPFFILQKETVVTFNLFVKFLRFKLPNISYKNINLLNKNINFYEIEFLNFKNIKFSNIFIDKKRIDKLSIEKISDEVPSLKLISSNETLFLNSFDICRIHLPKHGNKSTNIMEEDSEVQIEKFDGEIIISLSNAPVINIKPDSQFNIVFDCFFKLVAEGITTEDIKSKIITYSNESTIIMELENKKELKVRLKHKRLAKNKLYNLSVLDKISNLFLFDCPKQCKEPNQKIQLDCYDCEVPILNHIQKGVVRFRNQNRHIEMFELYKAVPNQYEKVAINFSNQLINLRFLGKLQSLKIGIPDSISEQPEEIPNYAGWISSERSSFIIIAILAWMSFLGAMKESNFFESLLKFIEIFK